MVLIYRIDGGGLTYVGSTIKKLQRRLIVHRSAYKSWKEGKSHYYITSFDVVKHDHKITLIEECTDEARQEREGYWIRTLTCVNKTVVGRTWEEYYRDWRKQPWYCEVCDITIKRGNKSTHLKSKRHQEGVEVASKH